MNKKDNQSKQFKHKVKIIILGNTAGKSQILNRMINNKYVKQSEPTIVEWGWINVFLADGSTIRLHFWDTSGFYGHRQIIQYSRDIVGIYFQGITVALFVYDITDQNSFKVIQEYWQPKLRESVKDDTLKILIGNKIDLKQNRKVNQQMVFKYAKQKRMDYFEVSAKTGENIQEMLAKIVIKIQKQILFGMKYSKQKLELQIKMSEEKKSDINKSDSLEKVNSKVNRIIFFKYISFIKQAYTKQ